MKKPKIATILKNGILDENPVIRMVLGCCPTLAITTAASNGIGMGLATTAVLVGSNAVISAMRNVIPEKVRIPSYIVIISGFVTIIQYLLKAYMPELDKALGIYIPLIVANCIILARAEMFAAKYPVVPSIVDGIAMGLGFTLALFLIGSFREILGVGAWMGMKFLPEAIPPAVIMILPPGGFLAFGVVITVMNRLTRKPVPENTSCHSANLPTPEGGKS